MTTDYAPDLSTVLEREPAPPGGTSAREVSYEVDGVACRGYLALPAGTAPAPGVLVLADWLGMSDHVRMRCDMLARLGYVALAGDVYGGGLSAAQDDAAGLAGGFYGDQPLWRSRVRGAHDALLAQDRVDAGRTAVIGFCFGGSEALELARTGADLRAAVSFHGALPLGPEGEAGRIRARLLVLTGAVDPVVPDEAVAALCEELRAAPDLDWQVTVHSGAMHAFAVPGVDAPEQGAQFQPRAEQRSWRATKDLLADALA